MANLSGRRAERIARLEARLAAVCPPEPRLSEEDLQALQALQATWDRLAATMAPEHVQWVIDDWENGHRPPSRLTQVVEDMIRWRPPDHLLTLPPEVAAVYLTDPAAHPVYDCENCGYRVPMRPEWWEGGKPMKHFPPIVYFPTCPLCGGPTGVHAYIRKHGTMP